MNEGRQVGGVHGVKEGRGQGWRNEVGEAGAWGKSCGEGGSAGVRESTVGDT